MKQTFISRYNNLVNDAVLFMEQKVKDNPTHNLQTADGLCLFYEDSVLWLEEKNGSTAPITDYDVTLICQLADIVAEIG